MKKLTALVIILVVAVSSANAQDTVKQKITLNNGVELIGVVSEEDGMTKIVMDNGDVFYYLEKEIKDISPLTNAKVKKGRNVVTSSQSRNARKQGKSNDLSGKTKGYFGMVGTHIAPFANRFMTIHGYFYKGFSVGLGAGIGYGETYCWNGSYEEYYMDISLPVFLHVSQEFMKTKVSPYIEVDFGYDLILENPLLHIMAGVDIKARGKQSFRVGGGYDVGYFMPVLSLSYNF